MTDFTYQQRLRPKRASTRDLLVLKRLKSFFLMSEDRTVLLRNQYIAQVCDIRVSHASMHVSRLVWLGYIDVLEAQQQGSKRPGKYRLTLKGVVENLDAIG